ncbi:MAG: DUF4296 domain-containing protein [Chitinophagaceae bacterium]|nr:MAG: DUF4296 domain-containing protein [Chitinophagaceae bacterium]
MKLIHLFTISCLLIACTDKKKIPSDVLPQPKMEKVLWDMMLADRFAAQYVIRDSATKNVTDETFKLYSQVFSVNDITSEQFLRSYKFYMTRPDLSKVMFDTVLARANRLKEETYRPKLAVPLDTAGIDSSKAAVAPSKP